MGQNLFSKTTVTTSKIWSRCGVLYNRKMCVLLQLPFRVPTRPSFGHPFCLVIDFLAQIKVSIFLHVYFYTIWLTNFDTIFQFIHRNAFVRKSLLSNRPREKIPFRKAFGGKISCFWFWSDVIFAYERQRMYDRDATLMTVEMKMFNRYSMVWFDGRGFSPS